MPHELSVSVSAGAIRFQRHWVREDGEEGFVGGGGGAASGGVRGAAKGFTAKSRSNMRWTFAGLPWWMLGPRLAMVTLTYPADWREVVPNREVLNLHVKSFMDRYAYRWGPLMGAWVLEAQPRERRPERERGAPHIHCYIGLPEGAEVVDAWDGYKKVRMSRWWWANEAWYASVGSEDRKHLGWGVNVRQAFWGQGAIDAAVGRMNLQRVADYMWRESGKWGQKSFPADFGNVGRPWGVWGRRLGFVPIVSEHKRSWVVGWELQRFGRGLWRATERKGGVRHGALRHINALDGFTVYSGDAAGLMERWEPAAEELGMAKAVARGVRDIELMRPGSMFVGYEPVGRRPGCGHPWSGDCQCSGGNRRARPDTYRRWAERDRRAFTYRRGYAALATCSRNSRSEKLGNPGSFG